MPGFVCVCQTAVWTKKRINPFVLPSCTEAIQFVTLCSSVAQWLEFRSTSRAQSALLLHHWSNKAKVRLFWLPWFFGAAENFHCSHLLLMFARISWCLFRVGGQLPLPFCESGITQKPKFCSISKCPFHSGQCEVNRSHPNLLEPPKHDFISTETSGWGEHP